MLSLIFTSAVFLLSDSGPVYTNPPGEDGGCVAEQRLQSSSYNCGYTWYQCFDDTRDQPTSYCLACANGFTGADRDFAIDACLVEHCDDAQRTAAARDCYATYAPAKDFNDKQLKDKTNECKQNFPNDPQRQGMCIQQATANWASNESNISAQFNQCVRNSCP